MAGGDVRNKSLATGAAQGIETAGDAVHAVKPVLKWDAFQRGDGVDAVSYTHLDVYKRQSRNRPRQRPINMERATMMTMR